VNEMVIIEQKGERLHEVMTLFYAGIENSKRSFLMMGQAIYYIKQERLWKLTGDHVKTFKQFCDNELQISIAQANRLEYIYREIGEILWDTKIDISKVTILLPYLTGKTEEEKRELIENNKDLSVAAIKNNLREARGEPATDTCLHTGLVEKWNRCTVCGKFFR